VEDIAELHGLEREIIEITDRHPQLAPDEAFLVWYLRAFVADDETSAVQALTGRRGDKSADAVYIDHEAQTVFVTQGKYHRGRTLVAESRSNVIALADLGRVLMLEDLGGFDRLLQKADPKARREFVKARNAFHRRGYRLVLNYVTTGKVGMTHKDEATQRIEEWDNASYEVYARSDLNRLMQDYVEGASPPVPTIYLPVHEEQQFDRYDSATGVTSWVFTMSGKDLGRLYNDVGDRLFARNIRGYLGKADVNKSIKGTLEEEPESFWYYNNGVTIICDEAKEISERGLRKLRVTNAQIINGQQTTRVLANYGDTGATVLTKVIVVPRGSETAKTRYSHLLKQIVTATNWQNAITESDIKSNDIEQVRLERELRKLGYQYLRKRQAKSEIRRTLGASGYRLVKKEQLAQFLGACLLDPFEVRAGKDRLFKDDAYRIIFRRRPAAEYLTFYWLGRHVSHYSRGDPRRGYAKWLVLSFIWSQIGDQLRRHDLRENFRYIEERYWWTDWPLRPLSSSIKSLFSLSSAFYRANMKTRQGVLDESTFFKHRNLHRQFMKFWNSRSNSQRSRIKRRLQEFLRILTKFER